MHPVDDRIGDQLRVWHNDRGARESLDLGTAHADPLDNAFVLSNLHPITHFNRSFSEQNKAGDEIIDDALQAKADTRNEKINYKIREHSVAKVPIILVVGAKEAADGTVAMRRLGGKDQENLVLKEATARLQEEAAGPLART